MHKSVPSSSRPRSAYRERLSPPLWMFAAALVCAPMLSLTLLPAGPVLALLAGAIAAIGIIAFLVLTAPTVRLHDGVLHAGRAHISVHYLGTPRALTGDAARRARGPELSPNSWHLIRAGVDGILVVPNTDERDPTRTWVISTRTPDRLAAAVAAAHDERALDT